MQPPNKRASQRFDIDLELYLELPGSGMGWQPSRTRNVSLGGVFVNTETRWPVGTKLHMQLRLPSGAMVEGDAIVRWPDDKGIGLQFDGLRAKDIWVLGKFIESLATNQAS